MKVTPIPKPQKAKKTKKKKVLLQKHTNIFNKNDDKTHTYLHQKNTQVIEQYNDLINKKSVNKKRGVKSNAENNLRGLSDSNLLRLRREVVLKLFGNCCFFCGLPKGQVEIEDHHIVKRKMFLLRYDWRNGIPVCKYGCHQNAENPWGKHKIDEYLVKNDLLQYLQDRSGNCKDFLFKLKMTKTDYKRFMYEDLKQKLKELELSDYNKLPF